MKAWHVYTYLPRASHKSIKLVNSSNFVCDNLCSQQRRNDHRHVMEYSVSTYSLDSKAEVLGINDNGKEMVKLCLKPVVGLYRRFPQ